MGDEDGDDGNNWNGRNAPVGLVWSGLAWSSGITGEDVVDIKAITETTTTTDRYRYGSRGRAAEETRPTAIRRLRRAILLLLLLLLYENEIGRRTTDIHPGLRKLRVFPACGTHFSCVFANVRNHGHQCNV